MREPLLSTSSDEDTDDFLDMILRLTSSALETMHNLLDEQHWGGEKHNQALEAVWKVDGTQ